MTDEEIICKGLDEAATGDEIDDAFDALYRLTAKLARKDAALREAIDLRVKLYRNGDPEGDCDNLSDDQVAQVDRFARKWVAALGEREKEKNNG